MPIKNATKRPQHVIDEAVKRHVDNGEQAAVLAKLYKVSKAGFYLWVKKYKQDLLDKSKRSGMSQADAKTADKQALIIEVQALKLENRKLRDKVLDYMMKVGE
jgi:transposase